MARNIGSMIRGLIRLAREHWVACVFACVVAIISVAPQIFFVMQPGYRGIQLWGADAEHYYVARVQAAADGYWGMGDVFITRADQPYMVPGLGEIIQAYAGKALGFSVPVFNTVLKFACPFAIVLLFYALALLLFGSKRAALLGSVFATAGYSLLSGPGDIIAFFHLSAVLDGFLTYTRPVNPEISTPILLIGLIVWYRSFFQSDQPRTHDALVLGLCAGADVYISIYPASFLFAVAGISLLYFAYKRDTRRVRLLSFALGIGVLATTQFLWNYAHLIQMPDYAESAMRQGLVGRRTPVLSLWLFALVALPLFAWPRRFSGARPFFVIASIALFIFTEQHVITGSFLQPQHYHWYMTKPLVALVLGMYATYFIERFFSARLLRTALTVLILGVLLLNASALQLHSYRVHEPSVYAAQRYASALAYLRSLPSLERVWANPDVSLYIPIYSGHTAPNNTYAAVSLAPAQFLADRMLLEYKLEGVKPEDIDATLKWDRASVAHQTYTMYWRERTGDYANIPDAILEQYAIEYKKLYNEPTEHILRRLHATMVVWDQQADPSWNVDSMPFARKVFAENNISIYRLEYRSSVDDQ